MSTISKIHLTLFSHISNKNSHKMYYNLELPYFDKSNISKAYSKANKKNKKKAGVVKNEKK